MSSSGPILLVEDDPNDLDVIKAALRDNGVQNEILCFSGAREAIDYLFVTTARPFIILSDIRMQGMNGLEFRNAINANDMLRKKSIPFIFLTAALSQEIVDEAYDMTVQGFLSKPEDYTELRKVLGHVVDYWRCNLHPNSF
jgi:CheY-like chemotaxis protein